MMKYIIIISIELPEEGGLRRRMMWLQWFGRMSERRVERARAPRSECIKYHRRCVCSATTLLGTTTVACWSCVGLLVALLLAPAR